MRDYKLFFSMQKGEERKKKKGRKGDYSFHFFSSFFRFCLAINPPKILGDKNKKLYENPRKTNFQNQTISFSGI